MITSLGNTIQQSLKRPEIDVGNDMNYYQYIMSLLYYQFKTLYKLYMKNKNKARNGDRCNKNQREYKEEKKEKKKKFFFYFSFII